MTTELETETISTEKGRGVLLLVALVFVAYAMTVAFAPPASVLGRFMVDDSLYYYGIARHVAAGDGSVFDGINETNGYHPLWMLALTPVYLLFGSDPVTGFHAALVMQALMLCVILALLRSVAHELGLSVIASAVVMLALCSPLFFHLWINGLESSLLAIFILAALRQYLRVRSGRADNPRSWLLLGVFCALAFLSRLDTVFFPIIIIAVEIIDALVRRRWRLNFLRSISVGSMMMLLGGPYLLRNLLVFGHIMPVSGYMKTPQVSGAEARFGVSTGGLFWPAGKLSATLGVSTAIAGAVLLAVALIGIALVAVAVRRGGKSDQTGPPDQSENMNMKTFCGFGVFMLYCLTHYCYVAIAMSNFCNTMWYYIPAILGCSLLLGYVVSAFAPLDLGKPAAIVLVLLAIALAFSGGWYRFGRDNSLYTAKLEAANWLNAEMPGKRGAAFDAGIVGYFSGGTVVNLDGLVNNLELKRYADAGELDKYLQDKQVDYVVQHAATDGGGKRAAWLKDELGPALGTTRYARAFGRGSKMTMYVLEVRSAE